MEQGYQMNVNRLPAPTWNWLHMNESSLSDIKPENTGACFCVEAPKSITHSRAGRTLQAVPGGMGADMDRLLDAADAEAEVVVAEEGAREEEPVFCHLEYGEQANGIHAVEVFAKENSRVTVVMDAVSGPGTAGAAAVSTKMHVGKNAHVRLIQVQLLGEQFLYLNDVGMDCEPGGSVEVLQLILGGERSYSGCRAELLGAGSSVEVHVGYLGRKRQRIDMNYVANHWGTDTKSQMKIQGVLRENAFKLLRGTIDFKEGSAGSEGNETEDVLLMGEDVVNQTIPLILCAEERVQGNHGATIGKLDDEVLFYLCSRGMTRQSAVDMIARARMESLNRRIPCADVQNLVQNYLRGVFGHGME